MHDSYLSSLVFKTIKKISGSRQNYVGNFILYNEISESRADIWFANFTGFFGVIPSIRSA